jgi:hypothetical protein
MSTFSQFVYVFWFLPISCLVLKVLVEKNIEISQSESNFEHQKYTGMKISHRVFFGGVCFLFFLFWCGKYFWLSEI